MRLNAVIVKENKRRIKEILRTRTYYSSEAKENNQSNELRFYKSESAAKTCYPKNINGVIHIVIDTECMEFFGENNVPISDMPHFSETDNEFIFTFNNYIKDLHCKITINNSF